MDGVSDENGEGDTVQTAPQRLIRGATAGALTTPAYVAVLYAGLRRGDLPFAPFDLFDWLTRTLSGAVITRGIDLMVGAIRALHAGPTAAAAKIAEQGLAIVIFVVVGIVSGVLIGGALHRPRPAMIAGAGWGAILSGFLLSIGSHRPVTTFEAVWTLGIGLAWGAATGWLSVGPLTYCPAAAATPQLKAAGPAPVVHVLDRRRFLIESTALSATVTVAGAVIGLAGRRKGERSSDASWSASHPLPNRGATVVPAPGTRSELTPVSDHYRIDIDTMPPAIDGQTWRLAVGGLVANPLALSLDDIRSRPAIDQFITLSCISNPVGGDLIGTTRWTGVSIADLLPSWRLTTEATHLKITSADGYFETISLAQIHADRRVMLAYAWDGAPLPAEHGFPLRVFVPGVYGMKQPKWIVRIDAIPEWQAGYWVERGWDRDAPVQTTSVIDTIAVHNGQRKPDGVAVLPVGGIAFAGSRGISAVEVRLDDGQWQATRLRTPISDTTWVIWRADLPIASGHHTLTVRCRDRAGHLQIAEPAPPHPSGATGFDSKTVVV